MRSYASILHATFSTSLTLIFGLALGLPLSYSPKTFAQPLGTSQSPLVASPGTKFWTDNANLVPMCWHRLDGFAGKVDEDRAKDFVRRTIEDGWIAVTRLRISWDDCPASGDARHVRVYLRIGDPTYNGTTLQPGMATLSNAADRMPPNDPPGLLMGFRSDWDANATTRSYFRGLILHEFGHVLGFGHEQDRTGGPSNVTCYKGGDPSLTSIGPVDPSSIMGWGYCNTAWEILTLSDIAAVQSIYGKPRLASIVEVIRPRSDEGAVSLYVVGIDGRVWSNFWPAPRPGSTDWNGWFPIGENTFPRFTKWD